MPPPRVYHRDLKLENILVFTQSRDIEVFVADFGLAATNKMASLQRISHAKPLKLEMR